MRLGRCSRRMRKWRSTKADLPPGGAAAAVAINQHFLGIIRRCQAPRLQAEKSFRLRERYPPCASCADRIIEEFDSDACPSRSIWLAKVGVAWTGWAGLVSRGSRAFARLAESQAEMGMLLMSTSRWWCGSRATPEPCPVAGGYEVRGRYIARAHRTAFALPYLCMHSVRIGMGVRDMA